VFVWESYGEKAARFCRGDQFEIALPPPEAVRQTTKPMGDRASGGTKGFRDCMACGEGSA
jgi:hypothetical protein